MKIIFKRKYNKISYSILSFIMYILFQKRLSVYITLNLKITLYSLRKNKLFYSLM